MTDRNGEVLMGDEVYQPGDPDAREDKGVLDAEDTLSDLGMDPYDEGWSPPERPYGVEHSGNTAAEQRDGESLGDRLSEERPDLVVKEYEAWKADETDDEGSVDPHDGEGEPLDDGDGVRRAGLLAEADESTHEDAEMDMLAEGVAQGAGAAVADEDSRPC
ncbi:hypothetical protein [Streptomyces sp. NBC_01304]|uniref:hypothetical protein n=1 Tax=Streptomyces sp. NBC_01304 TaxID=2903818 RepID=UPI002E114FA3|nr:hypothetical protein OG430_01290 [Streptomyces sp. NBC_01304]